MALAVPSIDEAYALEDRYRKERGRVFITGTQALVRLPLAQRRLDRAHGLRISSPVRSGPTRARRPVQSSRDVPESAPFE